MGLNLASIPPLKEGATYEVKADVWAGWATQELAEKWLEQPLGKVQVTRVEFGDKQVRRFRTDIVETTIRFRVLSNPLPIAVAIALIAGVGIAGFGFLAIREFRQLSGPGATSIGLGVLALGIAGLVFATRRTA